MQGVLNEVEFANPRRLRRWMLRAGGWQNAKHDGGIRDPKPVKQRRTQVLYRIGHSRGKRGAVPDKANLSSPWWLDAEALADISVSADTLGIERQRMARLRLSVSERYGVFDTIFCVRLRGSLGALCGNGNPVYDPSEAGEVSPPPIWAFPGRQIRQYFVPGLRDLHDRSTDLADQAFELLDQCPAHAWLAMDASGIAAA